MRFIVEFDFFNGLAMQLKLCKTKEEATKFITENTTDGKIIEIIGGEI